MKRSEINAYIRQFRAVLDAQRFALPPFCDYPADSWKDRGSEYDEIRSAMLGWDITDFGSGRFEQVGLQLITLRNGRIDLPAGKTYAEKIMLVRAGQHTPMHFHKAKMEDIIVRSGELAVKVYLSDDKGGLSDADVPVTCDGVTKTVPAGSLLFLKAGQSITMQRGLYHEFWAMNGLALVGEVSMVNDDNTDNYFLTPCGRFPAVDEDEPADVLLCNEYPRAR